MNKVSAFIRNHYFLVYLTSFAVMATFVATIHNQDKRLMADCVKKENVNYCQVKFYGR